MIPIIVLCGLALFISTITDIKYRQIPAIVWFPALAVGAFVLILNKINLFARFSIATGVFFLMMILYKYFHGGFGDVYMMTIMAFLLGTDALYIALLGAFILCCYTIFLIYKGSRIKRWDIPLAPSILFGFITYYIF